jgi:acetate kinase
MKPVDPCILAINGGSSSIKFALFEAGDSLRRILEGAIERIGLPEATFQVKSKIRTDDSSRPVTAPDHTVAVGILMDWLKGNNGPGALTAVGHRVVHGGPKYSQPRRITAAMIDELHRLSPFDMHDLLGRETNDVRTAEAIALFCYARICEGLGFLGIGLYEKMNAVHEGVIPVAASRVAVRVIHTDKELLIAETVCQVLGLGRASTKTEKRLTKGAPLC